MEFIGQNIGKLFICVIDCLGINLAMQWFDSDRFKQVERSCLRTLQTLRINTGCQTIYALADLVDLVARNSGHGMDRQRHEETQERRRREEERAKERLIKVEKERQHLQSVKSELCLYDSVILK